MRNWSLLLLACAISACASTGPTARALRAQQNTAVVLAFLDTAFNKHEVEQAFRLYVGPDYRQHNPHVADGIAGAVAALTRLTHEQFPSSGRMSNARLRRATWLRCIPAIRTVPPTAP